MQDINVKLNPGLAWRNNIQEEKYFHQQIVLKFKEETSEVLLLGAWLCMELELGHFGK